MFGSNTLNENETALARLIIDTLNLDFSLEDATANTPLYGEGFGLDSIDILEVALAVSQVYGVKLRSDDKRNTEIFKSLRSLSDYIQEKKLN
jgi:acyl carrier protein